MSAVLDIGFPCMGSDARLLLEPDGAPALAAAADARAYLETFDARLSRFRADSELCRLNADPREAVPVSPLLAAAVGAARWAAEQTGGLWIRPSSGRCARRATRARAPASRRPRWPTRWPQRRLAGRPGPTPRLAGRRSRSTPQPRSCGGRPGLEVDTGGTGKGLAADALAIRLGALDRVLVDCGGDIAVAGPGLAERPWQVDVAHPLTGERAHVLSVGHGGVATSGIDVRVWRSEGGGFAHHLLDPSTREPAWTGLIGVTALGASALEAEVLAKAALLSGADGARRSCERGAGLLFHEDGDMELAGPLHGACSYASPRARARARLRRRSAVPRRGPHDRPQPGPLRLVAGGARVWTRRARPGDDLGAIGLLMASGLLRRRGLKRSLLAVHEHTALVALGAMAVHGATLLGDGWLHPGLGGVARAVHDGLPHSVHRVGHHRGVPGGVARALLLRAPKDRGAAVAACAPA